MARPHDYSALPSHPAVGAHYKKLRKYGHTTVAADVTCPTCGTVRTFPLYTLRQQMDKPHFNGQCKKCGQKASRAAASETRKRNMVGTKRLTKIGYVAICRSAVKDEDLPFFTAMCKKGSFVFEHRLVMARTLGRPLNSNESVDHMDGNKSNNASWNLRLYVVGKNQPGSLNGHGTYYHEYQMALKRIRDLENQLDQNSSKMT